MPNSYDRNHRPPEDRRRPDPHRQDPRRRPAPRPQPEPEPQGEALLTTAKGLVAVFITILIVAVIIMLFAKSLFVSGDALKKNVKTGHLTETAYVSVDPNATLPNQEQVVATETTKKKKKKTTTESTEPAADIPEGMDTSVAGKYTVNAAVYLHPEPSSSSAELVTLPAGAEVEVFGSANYGWYYVEYDGQMGYAWGTYFNKM